MNSNNVFKSHRLFWFAVLWTFKRMLLQSWGRSTRLKFEHRWRLQRRWCVSQLYGEWSTLNTIGERSRVQRSTLVTFHHQFVSRFFLQYLNFIPFFIVQDLTTGINCEKCIANFYRPHGVSPNVQNPCVPCECNPHGSIGVCGSIGGSCTCRTGFTGPKCDQCAAGYSGENCEKCACNTKGTMPGGECEEHCQCKVRMRQKSNKKTQTHKTLCRTSFPLHFLTSLISNLAKIALFLSLCEWRADYSYMLKVKAVTNVRLATLDYRSIMQKVVWSVIARAFRRHVKVVALLQTR